MTLTKCKEKSGQGRSGESLQAHPDRHAEVVTRSSVQTRREGQCCQSKRLGREAHQPGVRGAPAPQEGLQPVPAVDQALSPSRADYGGLLPAPCVCSLLSATSPLQGLRGQLQLHWRPWRCWPTWGPLCSLLPQLHWRPWRCWPTWGPLCFLTGSE